MCYLEAGLTACLWKSVLTRLQAGFCNCWAPGLCLWWSPGPVEGRRRPAIQFCGTMSVHVLLEHFLMTPGPWLTGDFFFITLVVGWHLVPDGSNLSSKQYSFLSGHVHRDRSYLCSCPFSCSETWCYSVVPLFFHVKATAVSFFCLLLVVFCLKKHFSLPSCYFWMQSVIQVFQEPVTSNLMLNSVAIWILLDTTILRHRQTGTLLYRGVYIYVSYTYRHVSIW